MGLAGWEEVNKQTATSVAVLELVWGWLATVFSIFMSQPWLARVLDPDLWDQSHFSDAI